MSLHDTSGTVKKLENLQFTIGDETNQHATVILSPLLTTYGNPIFLF